MLIERTEYWAKPDREVDVLATHREANRVRLTLGLCAGIIREAVSGGGPDVSWLCTFADEVEHARDQSMRDESPTFGAVRDRMDSLVDRFERIVERAMLPVRGSGFVDHAVDGLPIVPCEVFFKSGGLMLAGYLYLPPGRGLFPCVITNHGSAIDQSTDDIYRPGTASLLMSWGVASFLPHRRGYGNSPGPGWRKDVDAEFFTEACDRQLAPQTRSRERRCPGRTRLAQGASPTSMSTASA